MSGLPDPVQIARMPYTQRNQTLMQMLPMLLRMKPEEAENVIYQIADALATRATDDEYRGWCDSMLRVLSSFDIPTIKTVLQIRSKALSRLPKEKADRLNRIAQEAIAGLDESVRNKLMAAMK